MGSCALTVTDARAAPSVPSSAGRTRIVSTDSRRRDGKNITLIGLPHLLLFILIILLTVNSHFFKSIFSI